MLYPHSRFTGEDTEAQTDSVLWPRSPTLGHSWDLDSSPLAPSLLAALPLSVPKVLIRRASLLLQPPEVITICTTPVALNHLLPLQTALVKSNKVLTWTDQTLCCCHLCTWPTFPADWKGPKGMNQVAVCFCDFLTLLTS